MDVRVTKGIVLDRDRIEAAVEHWGGRKAQQGPQSTSTSVPYPSLRQGCLWGVELSEIKWVQRQQFPGRATEAQPYSAWSVTGRE